ncbi:hypothetical protein OY671_009600, partial [Metschnikowia pulcherrima]
RSSRQVHSIHGESHDESQAAGFNVAEGTMGENITTRGIESSGSPRGACSHIGPQAVVQITGSRNPCSQSDHYQNGSTAAVLGRDAAGGSIRKAGVMGIVSAGGAVRAGDAIRVALPAPPHSLSERV